MSKTAEFSGLLLFIEQVLFIKKIGNRANAAVIRGEKIIDLNI